MDVFAESLPSNGCYIPDNFAVFYYNGYSCHNIIISFLCARLRTSSVCACTGIVSCSVDPCCFTVQWFAASQVSVPLRRHCWEIICVRALEQTVSKEQEKGELSERTSVSGLPRYMLIIRTHTSLFPQDGAKKNYIIVPYSRVSVNQWFRGTFHLHF
jgi:hypothetical protein